MNKYLSSQAQNLRQGEIRSLFNRAKSYENVISLGIGEPDFVTPSSIIGAACKGLSKGNTHYTANEGQLETRNSISAYLGSKKLDYDPIDEIIVTMGGMGALSTALLTVLNPQDEVLIQDPQWLNYRAQIQFLRGIPVPVPVHERDAFSLKASAVEKVITKNTKVLMINSPNNPTGAVICPDDLARLAELAIKHDLLVISDEVYSELVYDNLQHTSIASLPGMKERTIVINSLSKSFAMTGWRIGFAVGPKEIVSKMTVLQENLVACAPTASQEGLIYALSHLEEIEPMRKEYLTRRNMMVELINHIPGLSCLTPSGAFYIFANISKLKISSHDYSEKLLKDFQVVVIPGSAFGENGEGFVRISYASDQQLLVEAAKRIRKFTHLLLEGQIA